MTKFHVLRPVFVTKELKDIDLFKIVEILLVRGNKKCLLFIIFSEFPHVYPLPIFNPHF